MSTAYNLQKYVFRLSRSYNLFDMGSYSKVFLKTDYN